VKRKKIKQVAKKKFFEYEKVERQPGQSWYQFVGKVLYANIFGVAPRPMSEGPKPVRYAQFPRMDELAQSAFAASLQAPLMEKLSDFKAVYLAELLDDKTRWGTVRHIRTAVRLRQIEHLQLSVPGMTPESAVELGNTMLKFYGVMKEESGGCPTESAMLAAVEVPLRQPVEQPVAAPEPAAADL